jgi:hypothetical protein
MTAFKALFNALKPIFAITLGISFAPLILSALQFKAAFALLIPVLDGVTAIANVISIGVIFLNNALKDVIEQTKE